MSIHSSWALRLGFLFALIATLGSLYFSDVLGFPPCVLCWYQRICMYPLIAIFGVGLAREERSALWYSLPLVVIGWGIAIYHNLLYYKLIPEHITPCQRGISCTAKQVEYLGFITIPFLSLTAFTILIVLLALARKGFRQNEK